MPQADWTDANQRYLTIGLRWVRGRLERLARSQEVSAEGVAPTPPVTEPPRDPEDEDLGWWPPLRRRRATKPAKIPLALPSGSNGSSVTVEDEADLEREMANLESSEQPPALVLLGRHFALSKFERATLLLCTAMELDTRTPRLCARAHGDANAPYPTFALALAAFDEPSWDALGSMAPLRYWRLIEIDQHGSLPLTASPLRAEERVTNYLKGLNHMDERLSVMLRPLGDGGTDKDVPGSQAAAVRTVVHRLQYTPEQSPLPVVQLLGGDRPSKELVARVACSEMGIVPYKMTVDVLPENVPDIDNLGRLWDRETRFAPVALYLDASDATSGPREGVPPSTNRFLARAGGVIFLSTRDVWPGIDQSAIVDIEKPTAEEQQAAWVAVLGERSGENPALLAGQFDFSGTVISEAAGVALSDGKEDSEEELSERLWDACLAASRPLMETLAQRLDAKATWKDIVLPEEETRLLGEVAHQVRHRHKVQEEWGFRRRMNRGLGVTALFSGESGTGKTMAAEVLANHLRLNLYRIDLSAVVSKFIGETEKNLRRLFDAAEDGGAILFFDEADALFGKRSEVKDSHDRYANIEINYLLQRMEAYRGLAILGTNMKAALDQAFLRRLRFIIRFPFPAAAQRRGIWERAFPEETPVHELDYDWLSRINLTGGSIHSIAVNSAFRAAHEGSAVTMEIIIETVRTELRKLDRPVNESELQWVPPQRETVELR